MNVELPRPTYISPWDNVKHFLSPAVPSSQLGRQSFRKARKSSLLGNGKWEFAAGLRILSPVASEKPMNKGIFFQRELGDPAWPAAFRR